MPDDVKVIRQTTESVPNDVGTFVEHVRVEFKVGDNGPFYRRFPVEGFNAIQVRQSLDDFARELRAVKGS